jgi:hypothetical protein
MMAVLNIQGFVKHIEVDDNLAFRRTLFVPVPRALAMTLDPYLKYLKDDDDNTMMEFYVTRIDTEYHIAYLEFIR